MLKNDQPINQIEELSHYSKQMSEAITTGLLDQKTNNSQVKEKLTKLKKELEEEIINERSQIEKAFLDDQKTVNKENKTPDKIVKKLAKEAKSYLENQGRN